FLIVPNNLFLKCEHEKYDHPERRENTKSQTDIKQYRFIPYGRREYEGQKKHAKRQHAKINEFCDEIERLRCLITNLEAENRQSILTLIVFILVNL
ncbi:25072_t:CDS:1, partial [Dentiscutata erythropus]